MCRTAKVCFRRRVSSFRHYFRYVLSLGFLRPGGGKPTASTGLLLASAATLQLTTRITYSRGATAAGAETAEADDVGVVNNQTPSVMTTTTTTTTQPKRDEKEEEREDVEKGIEEERTRSQLKVLPAVVVTTTTTEASPGSKKRDVGTMTTVTNAAKRRNNQKKAKMSQCTKRVHFN